MQSFTPVHAAAIRNGGCGMEAKTVQRGSVRVLAVDHRGPYHTIGAAFDRLGMLLDDHGIDVSGEKWLAIFLDDPETVPAGELRSRACVTLAVGQEPPPGAPDLRPLEIPGGLYATTRYIGSYEGLPNAWNDLCGTWIPAHGLKPDAGLCFEVYERGCCEVSDPGELITDLFEPVRPVE